MKRYTKADLEALVSLQLENLEAMHDLLSIMKLQNELLRSVNKKLKDELEGVKERVYTKPRRQRVLPTAL